MLISEVSMFTKLSFVVIKETCLNYIKSEMFAQACLLGSRVG